MTEDKEKQNYCVQCVCCTMCLCVLSIVLCVLCSSPLCYIVVNFLKQIFIDYSMKVSTIDTHIYRCFLYTTS